MVVKSWKKNHVRFWGTRYSYKSTSTYEAGDPTEPPKRGYITYGEGRGAFRVSWWRCLASFLLWFLEHVFFLDSWIFLQSWMFLKDFYCFWNLEKSRPVSYDVELSQPKKKVKWKGFSREKTAEKKRWCKSGHSTEVFPRGISSSRC